MNAVTVFGLCGAILVGLGLYGVIVNPQPLRKILAFNLIGGGVFLVFGVIARRGAAAGCTKHSRYRCRLMGSCDRSANCAQILSNGSDGVLNQTLRGATRRQPMFCNPTECL